MDDTPVVVLDIGSYEVRAGFAGDDAPRAVFPTVIGEPRKAGTRGGMLGVHNRSNFVGDEAITKRGVLNLRYPVKNGIIENFDDWSQLVHHTLYNELRVSPEEKAVVFPVSCWSPDVQEQKIAQILFEEFGVLGVAGVNSQALTTYASGRGCALAVEIGHGLTQIGAIYEGRYITESAYRGTVAGAAINDYLARMTLEQISERGLDVAGLQLEIDQLKRSTCYTPLIYDTEMVEFAESSAKCIEHGFSDGSTIRLGSERIRAPELLFKPGLMAIEELPLSHLIFRAIMKSPMDVRKDLFGNIVLSGGCSLIPGLSERLQAELFALVTPTTRVKVIAPPERRYSNWIGGSIYGSLSSAQATFFSKEEYDEVGPSGIHQWGRILRDVSVKKAW